MALAANCAWELRPTGTTTGSGGFVSGLGGTDYSQSDSPLFTGTDLASTTGTATAPVVTSAARPFIAADVGNTIRVTAGTSFTTAIYQIVSVSAGAATLDKAVGSAATLTAGTFTLGGAIGPTATMTQLASAVAPGNTVWITGTFSSFPSISFTVNGTTALPIVIEGYQTTRGDTPQGANRPKLTLATSAALTVTAQYQVKNIQVTGKPNGACLTLNGAGAMAFNCKFFHNNLTVLNNNALTLNAANSFAINCEATSIKGAGINVGASPTSVHNCYVHDSDIGIDATAAGISCTITNNVIESCTTAAIRSASGNQSLIQNNTLYGSERKTGSGIVGTSTWAGLKVYSNIVYGFATGISMFDTTSVRFGDGNMFFNNATDAVNWTLGANETTGTNPGFVSLAQLFGIGSATSSTTTLTDTGANFSTVVDNRDFVNILSGTGITPAQYLIVAHTNTTLTLEQSAGATGSAISYQITTGRNFSVGPQGSKRGWPIAFPGGITTPVFRSDVGAVGADGGTYTDPGVANVKIGTGYQFQSVAKTGTYDGSDRWTDPGITNVRTATAYKANSTTNNRTGSAAIPTAANVRLGTAIDQTTGLLNLPAQADVKSGVSYDNGTKTGSFAGGISTDPGVANVRAGTTYLIQDANKTGTLDIPPVSVVLSGFVYDGATKTGNLASGGGGGAAVQDIVDGILNEVLSGHQVDGSVGAVIAKISNVEALVI